MELGELENIQKYYKFVFKREINEKKENSLLYYGLRQFGMKK